MIEHALICLLKDDKKGSFKTVQASRAPSIEKIREVYWANLETVKYIIKYCQTHGIKSHRLSSSLFPLMTYEPYRDKTLPLLEEVLKEYQKIDYSGVSLTMHPDQFILLSSANPNVNEKSRYELDLTSYIATFIPIELINIHVGSAAQGKEFHTAMLKKEFTLLDKKTQNLLSLENDEKSYCFTDVLKISQENNCMVVPDFHHERCYQKRQAINHDEYLNHFVWNDVIDENIYSHIEEVFKQYEGKTIPTFHLSSPINGWSDNFKSNCQHADYIDIKDYPFKLSEIAQNKNIRLDVEAKAKDAAIFQLIEKLNNAKESSQMMSI